MTSKDVIKPEIITKFNKRNKNIPKAESMQGNFEINDQFLEENLKKNNS